MKTTIARYLIQEFTNPGDTVLDPFCGSGVVPLEASRLGRQVLAADINPYGVLLTRAKLKGPLIESAAVRQLNSSWTRAQARIRHQDLRRVPGWVRSFFHPQTLRKALALRDELVERRDWFLLACLLGILHHQRPGFLSYPSSHLVPYLRDRLFHRDQFPELYCERAIPPRLAAKIHRAYRRPPELQSAHTVFRCDSRKIPLPPSGSVHALITSPPYMNELDYVRDNRLRLWFLNRRLPTHRDISKKNRERQFAELLAGTLSRLAASIRRGGFVVLVVGDVSRGGRRADTAGVVTSLFRDTPALAGFTLARAIEDSIPDLRRARRDLGGTKRETVLVFHNTQAPPLPSAATTPPSRTNDCTSQ